MALQKIGQDAQAKTIFTGLVESGKNALQQSPPADAGRGGAGRGQSPRARVANAHYMIGLGYLGLGDRAQARAELSQAVEASPDLLGARIALASIQEGR